VSGVAGATRKRRQTGTGWAKAGWPRQHVNQIPRSNPAGLAAQMVASLQRQLRRMGLADGLQELCPTSTRWLNTSPARQRCPNSRRHGRAPGIGTRQAAGWKPGLKHGHPGTAPAVATRNWRCSPAPAEAALRLRWPAGHSLRAALPRAAGARRWTRST